MVRYTDSSKVNKRMVAGYYLFLCLVGFAVLLGPTGSGIPITLIGTGNREHDFASPNPDNWDLDDCVGCHPNEVGNWTGTAHANAAGEVNDTHVWISTPFFHFDEAAFNASCAECHTTDIDGDGNWDVLGVTCFSCHNMTTPLVDYSGDTCGETCHTGELEPSEHPHQYLIWQNSAHANSLTVLRTSDHAAPYCMHCETTEAFVHFKNPDMIGSDVDTAFPVDGDFNSVSCPACHAVHANWSAGSPAMIRAISTADLCGNCHIGDHHPSYTVWTEGSHDLAGVECIDCHGYDETPLGDHFLNHTFVVDPDLSCGQSDDCHMGLEDWALDQLDAIQSSFVALTEEILEEAEALKTEVETYNATAGANITLSNAVMEIIDDVEDAVHYYQADGSDGFHDRAGIFDALDESYVDLLNGKAMFYMYGQEAPAASMDMVIIIGGAAGGLILGLVLGVLVGRRR